MLTTSTTVGRKPAKRKPKPGYYVTGIRIPKDARDALATLAAAEQRSLANYILRILIQHLEDKKRQ